MVYKNIVNPLSQLCEKHLTMGRSAGTCIGKNALHHRQSQTHARRKSDKCPMNRRLPKHDTVHFMGTHSIADWDIFTFEEKVILVSNHPRAMMMTLNQKGHDLASTLRNYAGTEVEMM